MYDPLAKDTDNDGIPDRYDNNFKDSDYYSSTYDVEVSDKELPKTSASSSKFKQKRKIGKDFCKHQESFKRRNFEENQYDSLTKDTDNDGIADRFDHNFKDSRYFESTFDVKNQRLEKDDLLQAQAKKKQNRKLAYDYRKNNQEKLIHQEDNKKKNFSHDGYTRTKGKDKKTVSGKEAIRDREKKKKTLKEVSKANLKKKSLTSGILLGAEKGQDLAKTYLSSGSEDNVGVEGAEKTLDTGSKLIHRTHKSFNKRKQKAAYSLSKNDYKLRKKKSKLDFRDELEKAKASEEYRKSKAYKKFQKRKQMKSSVQKKNHTRLRDRIKQSVKEIAYSAKNFIVRKTKTLLIGIVAVIVLGTFFISFGGAGLSLMMNTTNSTVSTTYLSNETVLSNVNQYYFDKEEELRNELASVESNYPDYDEYIINKNGDIGHNVHELLSYITARCGEVKNVSEVSQILDEMFQAMYKTEYKEEVEIRYRTVTETYVDEEGNEYTENHEEPYEYRKLIINLIMEAWTVLFVRYLLIIQTI